MALTNAYGTQATLKLFLNPGTTTWAANEETKLDAAGNAAARMIDAYTGRRFWQDATVKTREFHADSSTVCYVDDISTTTGLVVKVDSADNGFVSGSTTLTITTDFVLHPLNADDETPVRPFTRIVLTSDTQDYFPVGGRPGVQVAAKFGWPAVPDDVAQAWLIQSAQLYKASDAVFGAIQLGDGFATRIRQSMHPIAAALLDSYVREA